ncbi:MAG: bacillithiol biosynthesis cysteine-adding enzyme BshC [Candidatus Hydrogenedentes bacterium]|nr:bacillithiol biosynthesis cysteine-adding enzyme BshC [Candidatus Hydrogenedentota bacterium]
MHKNKIYEDYINSDSALSDFFSVLPKDFNKKLKDISFLSLYSSKSTDSFTKFTIVSGQQPAIFGGPLYTYYKIIALKKLAKFLSDDFNIDIQPIFWVHSWDNDWEEACVANFLTYDYKIFTVKYIPNEEDKGKALHKITLNKPYLASQIEEAFLRVKSSDFTEILKKEIKNLLDYSSNLSDWSTILLKYFFSNFNDVAIFEPHIQPNFTLLSEVIVRAIENHEQLYMILEKTSQNLLELKYKPQVHKSKTDAFFFIEENNKRTKVFYDEGFFISDCSQKKWTKSELLSILKYEPERFTPNLITRCIYQQMLLNPIIYIAGPAEVAYWAQLKGIFDFYSLPMPVIYPRPRIVLIPPKINKWLSDLGIKTTDILQNKNLLTNYFEYYFNTSVEINDLVSDVLSDLNEKFLPKIYQTLKEKFLHISELDKFYSSSVERINEEITKLIQKLCKLSKQKDNQVNTRITCIKNTLFPNDNYQERFFTPISFFSELGLEILKVIEDKTDIKSFGVQGIEL